MTNRGDLFCTRKGLMKRNKAMGQIEPGFKQLIYFLIFAASCIIYTIIGFIQAERSTNAAKINDDYTHVITEKAYDACTYPRYELDPSISVERF